MKTIVNLLKYRMQFKMKKKFRSDYEELNRIKNSLEQAGAELCKVHAGSERIFYGFSRYGLVGLALEHYLQTQSNVTTVKKA